MFWYFLFVLSLILKYAQQMEIKYLLGNPVLVKMVDRNYYSGLNRVAQKMVKLYVKYLSLRQTAPKLFEWD
jgi:hypothetical protein